MSFPSSLEVREVGSWDDEKNGRRGRCEEWFEEIANREKLQDKFVEIDRVMWWRCLKRLKRDKKGRRGGDEVFWTGGKVDGGA